VRCITTAWIACTSAEATGGSTDRLQRVTQVWRDAGFHVEACTDPDRMIWEQVICNLAFSPGVPLSLRLSLRIGQVLDNPEARALAEGAQPKRIGWRWRRASSWISTTPSGVWTIRTRHSECDAVDAARHARRPADGNRRAQCRAGARGRADRAAGATNALMARMVRALEAKQSMLQRAYGPV